MNIKYLHLILMVACFFSGHLFADEKIKPLQICATLPDLGNIAKEIGGDKVSVTTFAKGTEDPHHIVAKPSFVKQLSQADLLISSGLELEIGWLPVLIKGSRNNKVKGESRGHLDASKSIRPLEVPEGKIDRSDGDIHAAGNPHYLLDPINGLKVAREIKNKLVDLRPEEAAFFEKNFRTFGKRLSEKLIGKALSQKYSLEDLEKLALLDENGKLEAYLKEQKEDTDLGGWFKEMKILHDLEIIADHNLWPYFTHRFGIKVVGFIESKPGISPSTKHLNALVKVISEKKTKILIQSPYFNPKYGEFLADKTPIKVVHLAHQTGSIKEADDYISMIEYNIKALVRTSGRGSETNGSAGCSVAPPPAATGFAGRSHETLQAVSRNTPAVSSKTQLVFNGS